jgi:hypothetical protein
MISHQVEAPKEEIKTKTIMQVRQPEIAVRVFSLIFIFIQSRILQQHARRHNDQAHPPPEAEATGGTTKAQAVGGRVQRLVVWLVMELQPHGFAADTMY